MENIKNQILTNNVTALIFSDSSLDNPKGKLSVSINNLMLISNIMFILICTPIMRIWMAMGDLDFNVPIVLWHIVLNMHRTLTSFAPFFGSHQYSNAEYNAIGCSTRIFTVPVVNIDLISEIQREKTWQGESQTPSHLTFNGARLAARRF